MRKEPGYWNRVNAIECPECGNLQIVISMIAHKKKCNKCGKTFPVEKEVLTIGNYYDY